MLERGLINDAPGESKQNQNRKDGGSKVDPPQQSVNPANDDSMDEIQTSLTFDSPAFGDRSAHSGGSASERRERSTTWTA